jgi:hypothetical protein
MNGLLSSGNAPHSRERLLHIFSDTGAAAMGTVTRLAMAGKTTTLRQPINAYLGTLAGDEQAR